MIILVAVAMVAAIPRAEALPWRRKPSTPSGAALERLRKVDKPTRKTGLQTEQLRELIAPFSVETAEDRKVTREAFDILLRRARWRAKHGYPSAGALHHAGVLAELLGGLDGELERARRDAVAAHLKRARTLERGLWAWLFRKRNPKAAEKQRQMAKQVEDAKP